MLVSLNWRIIFIDKSHAETNTLEFNLNTAIFENIKIPFLGRNQY